MLKKSIIISIGIGATIAALVLGYVIFVKPELSEPVQTPVVSNGDDKMNTTPAPTSTPDDTSTPAPAPTSDDVSEIDTSDWKIYRNEEFGFEMKYPRDWTNENRESVVLFSENGPIGNDFGFRATEKNIYGYPFSIHIFYIPNIKNVGELKYFDFAHKGEIISYDYDIIKIGHAQEEFFKIKEKKGSFIAYIKINNQNYFEINYHDPKVDSLRSKTEQIISTFKFINQNENL
jgi:hypothetical protein